MHAPHWARLVSLRCASLPSAALRQVEGIFSGTLSYIFNSFVAGGPAFSDIVSEAKAAGCGRLFFPPCKPLTSCRAL